MTEYTVHPPGFSFNAADTGTEVVTKNLASDNLLTGNIVQSLSLTSSGELWGPIQTSAQKSGAHRVGIVISAALSGTTTVTIARFQRSALPTCTNYKLTTSLFGGASAYVSSFGFLYLNQLFGPFTQVVKPSSESWTFQQRIHYSTTAGVTTYSNSHITANAGTEWGYAGWASVVAGAGSIIGWIVNPSSSNGALSTSPSHRASKTKGLDTAQSAILYPVGTIFYRNNSKTIYSATLNASTPICAGVTISCDNSTTPRTYTLLTDPENENLGANEINLAFLDNGMNPYIADSLTNSVIFSRYTAPRSRIDIVAYRLFGINGPFTTCADLALDVDFPAPIGNCRIVYASSAQLGDIKTGLSPILTRRTTTTTPETGMTRMLRPRPAPFNVNIAGARQWRFAISGRAQPYQINDFAPSGATTDAIRVYTLPDSIVFSAGAAAVFTWGWSRYNRGTATWDVVSSGNSATYGGSGEWTATLTDPPSFLKTDAAGFRITLTITTGSVNIAFYVYSGTQSDRAEVWPYDCPKLSLTGLPVYSDCRWV